MCHGGNVGCLFDSNFTTVFSTGLTIGINDGAGSKHDANWTGDATGRTALKSYLPGGGPPSALTADTINATSVSGGALAKQTVTLTLNVGFGIIDSDPSPTVTPTVDSSGFGALELCHLVEGSTIGALTLTAAQATALNGTSVASVLTDANNALGGNGLPGYVGSFGDLNELVTALNESFNNCTASAFATAYLCVPTP